MGKYRIVPEREDTLLKLLRGLQLNFTERRLLKAATICHVEVDTATNSWEVLIRTQEKLSDDFLQRSAAQIKENCRLSEVNCYQHVGDVDESLQKAWPKLIHRLAEKNPSVLPVLQTSKPQMSGRELTILVTCDLYKDVLKNHAIPKKLEEIIKFDFGFICRVKCACFDETWQSGSAFDVSYDYEPYPDYEPPTEPPVPVQKKAETVPPPPAPPKKNIVATPVSSGGSVIFGSAIKGEATPVEAIDGELKSVVLEGIIGQGQIGGIRTHEFKTGTKLLTFSIVDKTDGIVCKKFFQGKDKDNFAPVLEQLKDGMPIRIKGSVRFDNYSNEYVVAADSLERRQVPERTDNAPNKRVELHAHTTMSMMDALVTAKKLIQTAAKWGHQAIAITDHGVVQAFPEAADTLAGGKLPIKVIYGMEGYLVGDEIFTANEAAKSKLHSNHIIIIAKNKIGLRNLYELVSLSHLQFLYRRPRIPKKLLFGYREGLILGSACEAGEVIRAIVAGADDDELERLASFYDYLEIQPIGNNEFLKRSNDFPNVNTDDDLRQINKKVAALAQKLGKPLVATGDLHFLNPEDSLYRAILMKGRGFEDALSQPPLYFHTTEEMLEEFSYLGEDLAYEAVVTNPNKIAAMVEKMEPIPSGLYSPAMPGAEAEIRDLSYAQAKKLYGENLPPIVRDRLEQELTPIIAHGFSALYLIAMKLVKKSLSDGYLVGSRGSVGSSFIATMTGITEVNPLPPHWRCPACQFSEFVTNGSVGCGYDLPNRLCPACGTPLVKDGHDIPFAVFLGFDGDKVPDIDLNFSGVYQPVAHKFTEIMFGRDFAYRAGTIATVADKTAYGYVMKFYEEQNQRKHKSFIETESQGCIGVKRTTGQHPAGIMVVPRDMDVHFFTPIQHPADDKDAGTITTHFDYHSISSRLVKLDILGHDDPTVIKMLEDLTHRDPKTIPFDDPATLSLFSSTEALGLTPEELGANSGTFGIPEFRTGFTRQMIDDTHPDCFSDLVRISGFSHGTDVWLGNAQELIRAGKCTLKDAISARDDIMMYLIHHGVDPLLSFKTMEGVRKGKGIKPDVVEILRRNKVPEWYIDSCQKIKYLFPRAHATAYVMMAYRIAFCKVHYPLAFYAAYFSIRAAEFDANVVARGKEVVRQEINALEEKAKERKLDPKESGTLIVLQLAWEMYLRGYTVEYVDIYESDAEKFIMRENSLLPPLASLSGMGTVAAHQIVKARTGGAFTSVDDLHKRSGISKTNIEILRTHGCLNGMSESDQIALFG